MSLACQRRRESLTDPIFRKKPEFQKMQIDFWTIILLQDRSYRGSYEIERAEGQWRYRSRSTSRPVPRSWIFPSATHISRSRGRKSVWATCPCHVVRFVTEFLPFYGSGRGRGRGSDEIFSSFRIQLPPYLATAPRGPRDRWLKSQTRPHASESVSSVPACSPFSLHTENDFLGNMWLS